MQWDGQHLERTTSNKEVEFAGKRLTNILKLVSTKAMARCPKERAIHYFMNSRWCAQRKGEKESSPAATNPLLLLSSVRHFFSQEKPFRYSPHRLPFSQWFSRPAVDRCLPGNSPLHVALWMLQG